MATGTSMKVETKKLRGIFNEYGYQIVIVGSNAIAKEAGNNRTDSRQSENVSPNHQDAMSMDEIELFCKEAGDDIAIRTGDRFIGAWKGEFV